MSTRKHGHHKSSTNQGDTAPIADQPLSMQKVSPEERTKLIEISACILWEHAGKPDGEAAKNQFWCDAEDKLNASQAAHV